MGHARTLARSLASPSSSIKHASKDVREKVSKGGKGVNQGANTDSSDINYLQQTDWQKQLQKRQKRRPTEENENGKWENGKQNRASNPTEAVYITAATAKVHVHVCASVLVC